jgi:hypothetical protein
VADFGGSEGGLSPLFYNGYMGHTRHAVLSRLPGIRFRFALWLSPGRGEEKTFKGRWRSGLQALKYRAEQRPDRREKTAQNNSFTKSLFFAVKSKGLQPLVGFRLQPVDALQLLVVFGCNRGMHCNRWLGFRCNR